MVMRTNKLIKINQEMIMNRSNPKNYILMEVDNLIETEEVEEKGLEVPMLVSLEDEDKETKIKIGNLVKKGMKQERIITKFQINILQRKKNKNNLHKKIMNFITKRQKKMITRIGSISKQINSVDVPRKITKTITNKRIIVISKNKGQRIQISIYIILMTINFT